MTDDFLQVATNLVSLIKASEFEKAQKLIHEANRTARIDDFKARQLAVHEITRGLKEAQKQREILIQTIENLPATEKFFALEQVKVICREFFDPEIARLRTRKRQLSQPSAKLD